MFTLLVAAVVAFIALGYVVSIYNGLVGVRNDVEKTWNNIDVVLQQRHDELMKLIDTCKAYMKHEVELLSSIVELRTGYTLAKEIEEKVGIENQMEDLVRNLAMVWEQYPDLKASQNFLQTQERVSALEEKIADNRELFNDSVNTFNIRIESFPDQLIAKRMRMTRRSFLQVPEEKKVDVKMDFASDG
jgi:LemA protein